MLLDKFYVLTNRRGQTLGIFTSPEKAMEHVYLSEIYQVYRGYVAAPDRLVWEDDRGWNWYARSPEDFAVDWIRRPSPRFEIHLTTLDWMGPGEDEVRSFARKFPPQSELMPVVDMWSNHEAKE